jgi:dipeptidase D
MVEVFRNVYGRDPKIEAIHAGLECGAFSEKIPNCDIITIGPEINSVHTPSERMSFSSFNRTCDFLLKVLQEL